MTSREMVGGVCLRRRRRLEKKQGRLLSIRGLRRKVGRDERMGGSFEQRTGKGGDKTHRGEPIVFQS